MTATASKADVRAGVAKAVSRYQSDWALWILEVLGAGDVGDAAKRHGFDGLTKAQRELISSVQRHKRTIGQSGHGVGKTWTAAAIALAFLYQYKGSQVICTSSSQEQVIKRFWAEFLSLHAKAKMRLGGKPTKTQLIVEEKSKWFAYATATNDPSNLHGGHAEHILFVIDEAQAVDKGIWEAAEGMMAGVGARTLALFNPLFAGGPAHEAARRPDEWNLVKLNCLDHPNVISRKELVKGAVTWDWVEERRRLWGEDHPLFQARVLGEFPQTSEDTLITLGMLEACADLAPPMYGDGTWLGLDVARHGSDSDWALVMEDGRTIYEEQWAGLDLMRTCGKATNIVERFDVPWDHVNVDGNGVGGGVVDRFRELDHAVNDIQFGGKAVGDWNDRPDLNLGIDGVQFLNRKAELHWAARCLLKSKKMSIPRRFERIWSDLLAPRFFYRSDGAIKIESKDEVKARVGRSPDAGDALILALNRERQGASVVSFI